MFHKYTRSYTTTFRLIVLCLTSSILLSACTSGILISHISKLIKDENESYLNNLLENLSSSIDATIYNASQINRILLNNADIQDILMRSQKSAYTLQDYENDRNRIAIIMNSLSVSEELFYTVFYDCDGEYLFDGNTSGTLTLDRNLFSNQWILDHKVEIDERKLFLIAPFHSTNGFYGNFKSFMIIRPLKDFTVQKVIAYIVVYADSSEFQRCLEKNFQNITKDIENSLILSIRLTDEDDIVIASTNSNEYGLSVKELALADRLLSFKSDYSGFTVYIEPSQTYLSCVLRSTLIPIFSVIIIILFVFGIAMVIVLQKFLLPLKNLTYNMRLVGRGNFKLKLDENTCRDIDMQEIYSGFNQMIEKIDNLVTNVYKQQLLLKSAQIQSLTYQINPHFLYNTLQTIEAIAEVNDTPEIQTVATSLAQMFRYNLKSENFVSLSKELDHLETYFSIERIRFRNQIQFRFDIEQKLYSLSVPKFILQPIVENAVIHAFKKSPKEESYILITGEAILEKTLLIYISDNGMGMNSEQVKALNQSLADAGSLTENMNRDSIGLTNVQQRIVNYYGLEYGLSITSLFQKGTCVTICLPYIPYTDTLNIQQES